MKTLTGAPLRNLPGEAIGPYSGWAITTVGEVDDYKHFLPRILQLATEGGSWLGTQPPVIADKLILANWWNWPDREQRTVATVFVLSWLHACRLHPDSADAFDWLCSLALLGLDIKPYLDAWISPPSTDATLQVASFLAFYAADVVAGSEEGAFWRNVDERVRHSLRDWLLSESVASTLAAVEVRVEDRWLLEKGRAALEAMRG